MSNIEHRKTLWTVGVVLSGGLAALLTNPDSYVKMVLIILGFTFFFAVVNGIRDTNRKLKAVFKRLEGLIK